MNFSPQENVVGPLADRLLDCVSVGAIAAFFMGVLPALSLLLTVVWTAIRIYETKTVQQNMKRRRRLKRVRFNESKFTRK